MEIQGMDSRAIVVRQVADIPILVIVGITVIAVIANDGALDAGNAREERGVINEREK